MTRRVALAVSIVLIGAALVWTPSAFASVKTFGYISMSDGVRLRYTAVRPADRGRFPVLVEMDPYSAGADPTGAEGAGGDEFFARAAVQKGFAIVGVNIRGTGCSGGAFDPLQVKERSDGATVVEWTAAQAWSSGHVGLFGHSYPGIVQFGIAACHPRHLDAIAPGMTLGDLYRDIAYPGGILNRGFVAFYFPYQKTFEQATPDEIAQGDAQCGANHLDHLGEPVFASKAARAPFIDSTAIEWSARSPDNAVGRVDMPVFATGAWQDQEAGDRDSYLLDRLDAKNLWVVEGNGGHNDYYAAVRGETDALIRFFRRYLKGERNGWERTPHLQVLHEVDGSLTPSWRTPYAEQSPHVRPLVLYLRNGFALRKAKPNGASTPDTYAYPSSSPSVPQDDVYASQGEPGAPGWHTPNNPDGYLAYTTPALTRDAEILGSGNADLWLSSTATDTDLQVTLTEVRPDGQEVYLQRGWLRASHRKEDPRVSTDLRPLHTDKQRDAQPLIAGRPTHLRVELFPVDHVFRKGSSIRLIIDAPTGLTGDWGLDFLNTTAENTIWRDAAHPSRFVLPLVPGRAHAPMPACGSVVLEPCRDSIAPVPGGVLAP